MRKKNFKKLNSLINYGDIFMEQNNSKKLKLTILCGLLAGVLSGCNSGNSSSNSTPSNVMARNILPDTQKLLRISNKTGSVISSVSIVTESGQLVHQSNSGLDCADKQSCTLDISGIVTNKNMLAKFYNSSNQLVSMARLKDNTNNLTYMAVYTNSTIFGANLFKQLVIFEKSTPEHVLDQLSKFFKYDSKNDSVFEDLGNYYIQELNKGSITGEESFYQSLSTAFNQHKTIAAPALKTNPSLLMTSSGCNANSIGDSVFKFLTPFSEIVKVGGIDIIGLGGTLFDTLCPADSFDFQGAFDQLNEKLDQIQTSIDALGTDVAALRNLVITQNENNVNVSMQQMYNSEIAYNEVYINFLYGSNTKSLSEFVTDRGGLDKLDRNTWNILFDTSGGIIGGIAYQNSNIKLLTSAAVLRQLSDIQQSKCGDYTKITDSKGNPADIIAATNLCTLQTIQTGLYMAALTQQAKLRMLDVVQVINSSTDSVQFRNNFGTRILWTDVPNVINENTDSRLNDLFAFMKNNVWYPLNDFQEMGIDFQRPAECLTTRFDRTKVFPDYIKWKDNNYDSITVQMSCPGKSPITRALLPGGKYHVDTANNKIILDNAADWERNASVNPLISPVAQALNASGGEKTDGGIVIASVIPRGSGADIQIDDCGDTNGVKKALIAQGREEIANAYSCEKVGVADNGPLYYYKTRIKLGEYNNTRFYIPVSSRFSSKIGIYDNRSFVVWNKAGYGLKADRYGTNLNRGGPVEDYDLTSYNNISLLRFDGHVYFSNYFGNINNGYLILSRNVPDKQYPNDGPYPNGSWRLDCGHLSWDSSRNQLKAVCMDKWDNHREPLVEGINEDNTHSICSRTNGNITCQSEIDGHWETPRGSFLDSCMALQVHKYAHNSYKIAAACLTNDQKQQIWNEINTERANLICQNNNGVLSCS